MAIAVVGLATELAMDESDFVSGLSNSITSVVAWGAALGAAAIAGVAFFTEKEFQALDATAKLGRELGFSSDSLRSFELGAKIAGQEMAGLETLLRKLPRSIGQANQGLLTQKRAFDDLGLDSQNLALLDAEERFLQVADAISQIEDPTKQAALAADIFGRAGQKFVPFLSQGRAGFQAMREESDRLNGSFSQLDDSKIEEANDAAVKAGTAFDSIFKQIALVVAPLKESVFDLITDLTVGFRDNLLPGIIAFVDGGLNKFKDFIVANGPIVSLYVRTIVTEFQILGMAFDAFVLEPLSFGFNMIGDLLGISGNDFDDWAGTLVESMIMAKFVFENFESFVDTAIDGALFHVTKFANDLQFFFTDDLPNIIGFFGDFMVASLTNAFADALNLIGGFAEKALAITANIDQILLGKISIKDVLTSGEGLADAIKVDIPELLLNTREEGFAEKFLREQFENSKNALGGDFDAFREAELAKLQTDENALENFFANLLNFSSTSTRENTGGGVSDRDFGGAQAAAVTTAVERGSLKDFETIQRSNAEAAGLAEQALDEAKLANLLKAEGNTIAFDTNLLIKDLTPTEIGTFQ